MSRKVSPDSLVLPPPLYIPPYQEAALQEETNFGSTHAEQARLAREADLYKAFFTTSGDILCLINGQGHFHNINPTFERVLGYTQAEAKHTDLLALVHPDDRGYTQAVIASLLHQSTPSRFSNRCCRKDGSYRWLTWRATPLAGTSLVCASACDITDQVEAKKEPTGNEEKFRLLAENMADVVMLHQLDATIEYVSPSVEKILGYTPEELLGTDPYLTFVHPDDTANIRQGIYQELLTTQRKSRTIECRVRRKDDTYVWFESTFKAVKDQQQQIIAIVTSSRDISHRKQEEERARKFEQRLLESNEELEKFAYVASHDLQEPLRVISSFLQVLQRRYQSQLDERAGQFIHYAVDGANRMKRLITDLLTYSRINSLFQDETPVDLNVVLAQIQEDLQLLISTTGTTLQCGPLPTVHANETLLYQVFLNLVSNAIKFQSDQAPHIAITAEEQSDAWLFTVSDNGIGISDEYAETIFDIFTRLNGHKYDGTGMGLSIVKKVIENYQGTIRLRSQVGQGTTFYFTLPRAI